MPQVESVKLSSESDKRAMQVELANSRREAAAAAAQLKHALANWQVGAAGARLGPSLLCIVPNQPWAARSGTACSCLA